jgi:hypothetical protein
MWKKKLKLLRDVLACYKRHRKNNPPREYRARDWVNHQNYY